MRYQALVAVLLFISESLASSGRRSVGVGFRPVSPETEGEEGNLVESSYYWSQPSEEDATALEASHHQEAYPYPYQYSASYDEFYPSSDDTVDDKTFTQVQDTVSGFLGEQNPEDQGLIQAALPVVAVGLLTVAISSIFANQVALNSTSNDTFPLLFQLPDPLGRKRRSPDEAEDLQTPVFSAEDRVKDAILMYSLLDRDEGCSRKVACALARQTKALAQSRRLVQTLVEGIAPARFRQDFKAYMQGNEDSCYHIQCSKCFDL